MFDPFPPHHTHTTPTLASDATALPSFISCFDSQVLLLLDANGILWPLVNGLRLRPPSDRKHNPRAPLRPYASIVSRQYTATKEDSVLVFALGKWKQCTLVSTAIKYLGLIRVRVRVRK